MENMKKVPNHQPANSLLLKMAVEIVSFPSKHGGSVHRYLTLPEGKIPKSQSPKRSKVYWLVVSTPLKKY